MENQYARTELLLGREAMDKLRNSRVAVFGVGGVGGYVVEALARCGVGELDLIDNDTVSLTNLNRQIIALHSTIGRLKTEVAAERVHDIDPSIKVNVHNCFFMPDTADRFDFGEYDYVVDAIDTVTGKIEIIMRSQKAGTPVISAMGAGNKLDPTGFKVADIYKTKGCPLAKVMRYELKKRGVKKLKVVYSEEPPIKPQGASEESVIGRRAVPGSLSFVPSAAGLVIASAIVDDLIHNS